jgi:hypothetical protein
MIVEVNQSLLEYYEKYPLWGILLFTEAHPHVIKALKDIDYYNALNEISGNKIAILTTMLFRGRYISPEIRPGSFGDIIPIWDEPNKNKEVLSWFDIEDSRKLPLLVLFTIEDNQLYHQHYSIDHDSSQEVFKSLREVLLLIPNELGADNKKLFNHMQWKINTLKTKHVIKKMFDLISMFRGVSGL